MKRKVLILGKTGMLGHIVCKVLARELNMEVSGTHLLDKTDHFYFDIETGLHKLHLICEKAAGFQYIINCTGITAERINSSNSKSLLHTITINAVFPHQLAAFAENHDIRVIHISTDGVFSGQAESYDEDSPSDCIDVYGRTKSLGEAISNRVLNIRCSIVGPSPYKKGGLYEWFSSQPENAVVYGYTNHYWNGISSLQFAELCLAIIEANHYDALRSVSSVFHFAPNSTVSKYDLLKIFQSALRKEITIIPTEHPTGPMKRILKSKYREIVKFYPQDIHLANVIHRMKDFE